MRRRGWHRAGWIASSESIAVVLLLAITIVAGVLLWSYAYSPPTNPPKLYYTANSGVSYPVWGDPTDCWPVLPHTPPYYLGNGTGDPRYNTYMNAWWNDCEYGTNGTYNTMNATEIVFTQVTQPVALASVQFDFICHNSTPAPLTTFLVQGSLQAMSWFPGSSETLPADAPYLWSCGTFNASGFGGGANSVYYNRLGFFKPLTAGATTLAPGDSIVIYVNTYDAVLEAPNPIEPTSTWYLNDIDDYHGAPGWCFTTPNACEVVLVDTAIKNQPVLATVPLYSLHQ
jgi:hypothetical protein